MLELAAQPKQAASPAAALCVGKPVRIVACCPFPAAASLALAAGAEHATLLSVKAGGDGPELKTVDRAVPHEGAVDAVAWGEANGQLRLATVGPCLCNYVLT